MVLQMQDKLQQLERKVKLEGATEENLKAFWRMINRIKLQGQVEDGVFERIIKLRDRLFDEKYPRFLSLWQGLTITAVTTFFGVVLVWYALQSIDTIVFIVASFLMLAGTHSWGHWIAGKLVGVSYEYFYLDGPEKFALCLKINYRDYLKASFDSRRILHASGALATVLTALTLLLVVLVTESVWILSVAVAIFILVIVTEIISWTGIASGDLKRARRERRLKIVHIKQEKTRKIVKRNLSFDFSFRLTKL